MEQQNGFGSLWNWKRQVVNLLKQISIKKIFFCRIGEIVIQRLNWQKIVTFPSPGEDVKVRGLSWQYDETIIAVG